MKCPFIITIIQDVVSITEYVNKLTNDEDATRTWLNSENSALNGKEPIELIFEGRTEEVLEAIKAQL